MRCKGIAFVLAMMGVVCFWGKGVCGEETGIRLFKTLEGHGGSVCSVAFSPDGKCLASGSSDNTIKLWEIPSSPPSVATNEWVINAKVANIRSGHSTKHPVIGQAEKGEKIFVTGEEGDWYRVMYNDKIGYIHKSLMVKNIGQEDTNNPANQFNKTQTQGSRDDFNLNKFFFKDISLKKKYVYTGIVWRDYLVEGDKLEDVDDEGNIKVNAILTVLEIAKLSKGKIYELSFSVTGAKTNTKQNDEKLYLWITEDKIYNFSLVDNSDYIKYAKKLEKSGQLPSKDKTYVRCSNDNMKFTDGLWETEIKNKNNSCIYLASHSNSGHYIEYIWEIDKGLTTYSWGSGARSEGLELHLVEDNRMGQNVMNQSEETESDNNNDSVMNQ